MESPAFHCHPERKRRISVKRVSGLNAGKYQSAGRYGTIGIGDWGAGDWGLGLGLGICSPSLYSCGHSPWRRGPESPMDAISPSAAQRQAPSGIQESTAPPCFIKKTRSFTLRGRSPYSQASFIMFLYSEFRWSTTTSSTTLTISGSKLSLVLGRQQSRKMEPSSAATYLKTL